MDEERIDEADIVYKIEEVDTVMYLDDMKNKNTKRKTVLWCQNNRKCNFKLSN